MEDGLLEPPIPPAGLLDPLMPEPVVLATGARGSNVAAWLS
jgi:hypothetical protein